MNDKRTARTLETLIEQERTLTAQPQTLEIANQRKHILLRINKTLKGTRHIVSESAGVDRAQGLKLAKPHTNHRPYNDAA